MASPAAVRFVANKSGSPTAGYVQLRLRVKPGTSKIREGILNVTNSAVELCVAAQPRQGAANEATLKMLSEALDISKSQLRIVSGLRSKDKIAIIDHVSGNGRIYAETILSLLHRASRAVA